MKQLFALIIMSLMFTSCGFEIVDPGHVGVKVQMGEIVESGLTEGMHFHMPLISSVKEVDTRLQRWDAKTTTFTKDVQNTTISYTVNYSYDPKATETIFRQGNELYADKVMPQVILGKIKEVIGQYEAENLVSQRAKLNADISLAVTDELANKYVIVSNFEITDIDFSDEFERAIEAKQVATQEAKRAQNETVKIREEKEQAILTAQGAAEAMRIKSEALSKNKSLVEYEAVQKWDGRLPQYNFGGGATPFINVSNLKAVK